MTMTWVDLPDERRAVKTRCRYMSTDRTKAVYEGPTEIGHFTVPGRGTSYTAEYAGHQVQVYITEKRKQIRIFVDGHEWKATQ